MVFSGHKLYLTGIIVCSKVSFDVPYAPHCTWGRCYDYKAIADAIDFLVIMDYDMATATAPCVANSNSPYYKIVQGQYRLASFAFVSCVTQRSAPRELPKQLLRYI